jgi:vacuolar iron transporter family protein
MMKSHNAFSMYQQDELNSAVLYGKIAKDVKNEKERETLLLIAKDEQKHALVFERYTGRKLTPNYFRIRLFLLIRFLLGYTFLIKFLEYRENRGIQSYQADFDQIPEVRQILADEEKHEKILMDLLDEDRLHYMGDIILGMNDALVELTGSLAGYTLAMQNAKIIAMAGLITGVSATLSMAGSGYLAAREDAGKNAVKSTVIIGLSYFITVVLLILPYLIVPANAYLWALLATILIALLIIAGFNFYISVAKDRPFGKGFWSMAGISIGVAVISFAVGYIVKDVLGISL